MAYQFKLKSPVALEEAIELKKRGDAATRDAIKSVLVKTWMQSFTKEQLESKVAEASAKGKTRVKLIEFNFHDRKDNLDFYTLFYTRVAPYECSVAQRLQDLVDPEDYRIWTTIGCTSIDVYLDWRYISQFKSMQFLEQCFCFHIYV